MDIVQQAAEIVEEEAAIQAATDQAKAFRDKLEADGISYLHLLELMDGQMALDHIAHNILVGWETGRT